MYSVHSGSSKRGLLRPHAISGNGPIFRNLPLFGFLAGLVLFFFIFYIYQAQSTELNMLREQIERERNHLAKIKFENSDLLLHVEKYKQSEANLKKELESAKTDKDVCDANLKTEADKVQTFTVDLEKLRAERSTCTENLAAAKSQQAHANQTIDELLAKIASKENFIGTQNKIIQGLQAQLHGNAQLGQVNANSNLPVQQGISAMPQGLNQFAGRGNISQNEKSLPQGGKVSPQMRGKAEQQKTVSIIPKENMLKEVQGLDNREFVERPLETGNAANAESNNVLPPPPAEPENQPNQAKIFENPLHEPPKLENILEKKKNFEVGGEEENVRNADKVDDGKKIVGGAYDDNGMSGEHRAANTPSNLGNEEARLKNLDFPEPV